MKIKGIYHITGEPDTGKTLLALSAFPPKETAYLFDDVKTPPIEPKEFAHYSDMAAKHSRLKLLEYYQAVTEEIEQLPECKSIIFDTWTRFGKAIRYYAKANPTEFREAKTFSIKGSIKGMEEWGETHRVESDVISRLSQKCEALFLITHIKPQIKAGIQTGSYEPDAGKSFNKIANVRLWLRHNPHSGVPIALVLKRLTKIDMIKGNVRPVNVLPRKLVPEPEDHSTWDVIRRYWNNPVGNQEPKEHEIPTPFELSILDGVLTDEQKEMWHAELREKERQENEEREVFNLQWQEIKEKVLALGVPAPLAYAQVKDDYPLLTIDNVKEMINGKS